MEWHVQQAHVHNPDDTSGEISSKLPEIPLSDQNTSLSDRGMRAQTWKWWSKPSISIAILRSLKSPYILIYTSQTRAYPLELIGFFSLVHQSIQRCDIEHVISTFAPEIPDWFTGFYSRFFMFCHFWLSGSSVRHSLQNQVHGLWKTAYALYPCTLMFYLFFCCFFGISGLLPLSPFRHLWFLDPLHVFWLLFSTFFIISTFVMALRFTKSA